MADFYLANSSDRSAARENRDGERRRLVQHSTGLPPLRDLARIIRMRTREFRHASKRKIIGINLWIPRVCFPSELSQRHEGESTVKQNLQRESITRHEHFFISHKESDPRKRIQAAFLNCPSRTTRQEERQDAKIYVQKRKYKASYRDSPPPPAKRKSSAEVGL